MHANDVKVKKKKVICYFLRKLLNDPQEIINFSVKREFHELQSFENFQVPRKFKVRIRIRLHY